MQEIGFELPKNILPDAEKVSAVFRSVRDKALTDAERRLKLSVDTSVQQSGLQDTHGKVRRWQQPDRHKGYVAVRAEASSRGPDSPGAITNYLEGGHAARRPGGKSKRYRPRITRGRARSFHFYRTARSKTEQLAQALSTQVSEEIAERLEKL